ncbi:MAG: ABC transporter permease [Flavobacteriales bacterium]|nr:ABC transporter permease [Flavobacteriales bacterium]
MALILRLFRESFLFAWQALVANKLRTVLSLLGVTIGIFLIIIVLSLVDSLEADMKGSFDMIGNDIIMIQIMPIGAPDEGDEEYEWWKYFARPQPTLEQMEELRGRLTSAQNVAYRAFTVKTSEYKNSYFNESYTIGITYEFREVIAVKLASGRYFTPIECEGGGNFAIIGDRIREELFGSLDPIGKEIKVGGQKVSVIGVMTKEGAALFSNGFDQAVLLPIHFSQRLINLGEDDGAILIKPREGISAAEMKDEIVANFRPVRKIKPGAPNNFSVNEASTISKIIEGLMGFLDKVGIVIGICAILIGAFNIANIMFVSVRERTNIIGIQKSLGAKNSFVMAQFLFESIALCLIGGAIGLLLVYLIFLLLGSFVDFDFMLPTKRIVLGLVIAVITGLVSGIIPAWMAARMNPVDAIRSK